jgi:multicomponent Na+:H+ antiporter subunit A
MFLAAMLFDHLSPAWMIALPLLAVPASAVLGRRAVSGPRLGLLLGAVPAAIFLAFAIGGAEVLSGRSDGWRGSLPWLGELGIDWDLWLSPLGLVLALLVTGLGTLIAVYAGGYFGDSPKRGRFYPAFFAFLAAMLGLAVTENLVVLFVFWELTSVASYLLIGFYFEKEEPRVSARDSLLVTGAGGVALLAGILMLGEAAGDYRIGVLTERAAEIAVHPLYPAIFWCVFAGAMTKSAQIPCHFWLPGAMAAPAPVSAYLHSATMVKAGVFLLALLHPVLGGTPLWHFTLMGFGAVTATWAALVAMAQTDLKRLLAYTTLSTLGTLTMLLGLEHALAAKAAVVLLIVHALYKGSLFMVAGALEKLTGTRDVRRLGGLMRAMPGLGISAAVAAASMSGLPPFVGFIAKELLYEVKLESPYVGWPLLVSGFIAGAANLVVALRVGVAPFLAVPQEGEGSEPTPRPHPALWIGPALLGGAGLVLGLFPNALLGGPVSGAVAQIRVEEVEVKLALWHGFNLVLLLSAATVGTGLLAYLLRDRLLRAAHFLREKFGGLTAQGVFRNGFDEFLKASGAAMDAFQGGRLARYLAVVLGSAVALLSWALWTSGFAAFPRDWSPPRPDALVAGGLVALAACGALAARSRMAAVLCLGCAGFGLAAIFALSGAPDLAITQILVETLTLALFALAIYGLPALEPGRPSRRARAWTGLRILLAGAVGVLFTLLTLKAIDLEFSEPVAREIARLSVPEGFGRNVVNVILVDFRALDTFGESAVLAIAALGVAAMFGRAGRSASPGSEARPSPVLLASARYTAPAMLVFSLFLLLRGHNEPGGGFIGGLTAAMASILGHLARPGEPLRALGLPPVPLIGAGLGLALLSGVPGLLSGAGFLAAAWGPELSLPAVGKVKLGSPLLFDIGVFLVVAGVVLTLYREMALGGAARRRPERWT